MTINTKVSSLLYFLFNFKISPSSSDFMITDFPILFIPAPINVWRAFVMIITLLTIVAAGLIGYLIGYHVFLAANNMTTFEHTIKLKEKDDQEKKERQQRMAENGQLKECCFTERAAPPATSSTDDENRANGDHLNSPNRKKSLDMYEKQAQMRSFNKPNGNYTNESTNKYEGILPALPPAPPSHLAPIKTISSNVHSSSNSRTNDNLQNPIVYKSSNQSERNFTFSFFFHIVAVNLLSFV